MDKVRYGIIGIGNMGSGHCKSLFGGLVKVACLTAVFDIKPERLQWAKENLSPSVALFDNDEEFFEKAQIDVVIIAVPHYQHPPLGIEAFRRGIIVFTVKPAGVYT